MEAINEIFKAGSLKAMVEKGILKKESLYECIMNNIPFVLAGSIRDDGPIPDVLTDVVEAQREYKKVMKVHKNGFNVIHHVTFYCSREYVTCKSQGYCSRYKPASRNETS